MNETFKNYFTDATNYHDAYRYENSIGRALLQAQANRQQAMMGAAMASGCKESESNDKLLLLVEEGL